jgi:plasmid stability protein
MVDIDARLGEHDMTTLTIRNVDEAQVERLRRRAAGHNRSLEAELRHLIAEASARPTPDELLAWADRIAAMTPDVPQTDSTAIVRRMRDER